MPPSNKSFNRTAGTKPKPTAKQKAIKWGAIGFAVLVALVTLLAFFPNFGTMRFGLCRTYLELQEPYPQSLLIMGAYEYGDIAYINYKKVDPFGLESMMDIQCTFGVDEAGWLFLKSVDINGKKKIYPQEEKSRVEKFNKTIMAIDAYRPSLRMPWDIPNDIKEYR